jgi:hypothetical protein
MNIGIHVKNMHCMVRKAENHCQGGDFLQEREILLSKRISLDTLAGLCLEPTKSCLGHHYFNNQGRTYNHVLVQSGELSRSCAHLNSHIKDREH